MQYLCPAMRDNIDFKNDKVSKLFLRFLLPTVLGMVSSAVFIVTDGIFVGRGIGSDALAAINITTPFYMLSVGFGLMFGMGGSVVTSINLARGKARVAGINATQAIVVPMAVIIAVSALVIVFARQTLEMFKTPASLMPMAHEYLIWLSVFIPSIVLFNILMFLVRLDGAPKTVMYCNLTAAGLNIVLDYLFIFPFGWGLMGAAVATGIGYTVGALAMLFYLVRRSRTFHLVRLKLSATSLRLTARNAGYMAYVGFPALLSESALACMVIAGNLALIRYSDKEGIAAYSIVGYIFPIIFMLYSGIVQAAQPILSYNYGVGETDRTRRAFHLALSTVVICGVVFLLGGWFGAGQIAGMFLPSDAPAYALALQGIPLFALGYLFFGINVVVMGYLQSIERSRAATGLTLLRGVVFLLPAFTLLPRWLGINGIWLAVPAAEAATTLLILVFAYKRRPAAGN